MQVSIDPKVLVLQGWILSCISSRTHAGEGLRPTRVCAIANQKFCRGLEVATSTGGRAYLGSSMISGHFHDAMLGYGNCGELFPDRIRLVFVVSYDVVAN
jgi:hypothetical protein